MSSEVMKKRLCVCVCVHARVLVPISCGDHVSEDIFVKWGHFVWTSFLYVKVVIAIMAIIGNRRCVFGPHFSSVSLSVVIDFFFVFLAIVTVYSQH